VLTTVQLISARNIFNAVFIRIFNIKGGKIMGSMTKPILLAVIAILAVVLFLQTSNVITGAVGGTESTPASISTTLGTTNTVPTANTAACGTWSQTPVACANTSSPVCTVNVHDNDGWKNISSVAGYLNKAGAATCSASEPSCYLNATCVNTTEINITDSTWTCTFNQMTWFADNGTWTFYISASDGIAAATTSTTKTRDALNAIDVPTATINWGSLAVGGSAETTENVANCGNIEQDFQVNGSTMGCSIKGNIGVGNVTYGMSAQPTTKLTGTYATIEADLAMATFHTTNATKNTYWNVTVPVGASGTCTGTIYFIATKNQTTT
jgi:hypothetical protein